jgi:imidazole glycerol phosphate synthase subunit HisF
MRIGSILLLDNQRCVQSYHWKNFRPLGSLQLAMDSLEEFECDEVAIIRPVRNKDSFELFTKDLDVIRALKTMTPITFGGGIRTLQHLELLKDLPIERLMFSSSFITKDELLIEKASCLFGHQAVQCVLPVKLIGEIVCVYDCKLAQFCPLEAIDLGFVDQFANEVVIYDVDNDGAVNSFNESLLDGHPFLRNKIVVTGGIGKCTIDWARRQGVASVLIDNKALHQECSIKSYKHV